MNTKQLATLAKQHAAAQQRLDTLTAQRADAIREAIGAGVAVTELAAIFGLSIPRIYQIRDGRR